MDRRFLYAVLLAIGVLLITPKLFPPVPPPVTSADTAATVRGDSAKGAAPAAGAVVDGAKGVAGATGAAPAAGPAAGPAVAPAPAPVRVDTTTIVTPRVTWRFSSAGGALIGASLADFMVLPAHERHVELARAGVPLVSYRLLHGGDTVDLARVAFTADTAPAQTVAYHAALPAAAVALRYTFVADSYLVRVQGMVRGADTTPMRVVIAMPMGLASSEADTLDDHRSLAYVWKPPMDEAQSEPFSTIVKKGPIARAGPFEWVASKSKYFLLAVIAPDKPEFSGPVLFSSRLTPPRDPEAAKRAPAPPKVPAEATAELVVTPDAQGRFAFEVYAGPQQWRRLVALGHGLQDANPYGGFARGLIQPISRWVVAILLWMHDTFGISYGWVLIIFGVGVRLILWPLNQSAMRSSLRMQRIQPELQALQAKHKGSPEKMQAEYMKLLESHGMTPFSQFSGCLPMLIPMPVLFALFFVFRNTIEFRGVPFWWMSDLSLKDPYYILPIVMGLSMFLLSWVGLRNAPPNPQAKMMGYMMPGMMVVLFLGFPAGLNLYYGVQNLAALPQQWMIAQERAKQAPPRPAVPQKK